MTRWQRGKGGVAQLANFIVVVVVAVVVKHVKLLLMMSDKLVLL